MWLATKRQLDLTGCQYTFLHKQRGSSPNYSIVLSGMVPLHVCTRPLDFRDFVNCSKKKHAKLWFHTGHCTRHMRITTTSVINVKKFGVCEAIISCNFCFANLRQSQLSHESSQTDAWNLLSSFLVRRMGERMDRWGWLQPLISFHLPHRSLVETVVSDIHFPGFRLPGFQLPTTKAYKYRHDKNIFAP